MPSNSLGINSAVGGAHNPDVMRHQRGMKEVGMVSYNPPPSMSENNPPSYGSSSSFQSIPRTSLTAWNTAMFLFHSGLLALTLYLGNLDLTVPLFKTNLLFVRTPVSTGSEEEGSGPGMAWQLVPKYTESGVLYFTWTTASFFFLSAFFHLLNATCLRSFYLRELAQCRTPTRYVEYTFSASVMQVLIAYTLGIRERFLLLSSAVLIGITMPFGYWSEMIARPSGPDSWTRPLYVRLFPWVTGHIPQVTAWAILVVTFYDQDEGMAPDFVQVILWGELFLFFSFGFVALYQQMTVPKNFYKGELAFQVLSLVAKGLLGGLLIANVLMLSQFEDLYE